MELPAKQNIPANQMAPSALSRKQRKKRKDPNAPKRASNAYMIFCKERRAQLKEERPDLPFGQLGAKLGEMWRELSNEQKKPYETQASMDRDRYKKAMHSYSSGLLKDEDLDDEGDEGDEPLDEDPTKQSELKRHKIEGGGLEEPEQPLNPHTNDLFELALQTEKAKQEEKAETQEHQQDMLEEDHDEGDDVDDEDEGDEGDEDEEYEL